MAPRQKWSTPALSRVGWVGLKDFCWLPSSLGVIMQSRIIHSDADHSKIGSKQVQKFEAWFWKQNMETNQPRFSLMKTKL